jgi:hypothetical protein
MRNGGRQEVGLLNWFSVVGTKGYAGIPELRLLNPGHTTEESAQATRPSSLVAGIWTESAGDKTGAAAIEMVILDTCER